MFYSFKFYSFCLLCNILLNPAIAETFIQKDFKPLGWLWYGPEPSVEKAHMPPKHQPFPSLKARPLPPVKQLRQLRKTFDHALAKALLDPSVPNMVQVQRLQQELVDKAATFASLWQLVSLIHPTSFDQKDRLNSTNLKLLTQKEEGTLETQIKQAAATHGIFFFVKQGCPFCEQFSPTVKTFTNAYGFAIKVIARGAMKLKEFDVSPDNGIIDRLNPQGIYPALFLVSAEGVIPLAWGLVSYTQLKENLKTVLIAQENAKWERGQHAQEERQNPQDNTLQHPKEPT